jgi:hypothetical protein
VSDDVPASAAVKVDPRKKARARELWERLAKSRPGPANKDLIYLARFVPVLAKAAVKSLISRKLNVDELKELVQYVPIARDAAVKAALKKPDSLSEDDLRFLIIHTKSKEAAGILLERNPGDGVIAFVERSVPELDGKLEDMKQQELTAGVLREIDRVL